jgi:hypothetical protein
LLAVLVTRLMVVLVVVAGIQALAVTPQQVRAALVALVNHQAHSQAAISQQLSALVALVVMRLVRLRLLLVAQIQVTAQQAQAAAQ